METVLVIGWGDLPHQRSENVFKVQIAVPANFARHPQITVDPEWSLDARGFDANDLPVLQLRLHRSFDRRHASKCSVWGEPFRWVELQDGVMESCDRIPARRVVFFGEDALDCAFMSETALPKERVAEAWKICESIVVTPCKKLGAQQDDEPFYAYSAARCDDGTNISNRDFMRYAHRHGEKMERERTKSNLS